MLSSWWLVLGGTCSLYQTWGFSWCWVEGQHKMCLHVLPAVKLDLRSMIKVSHCRKLFSQLCHRMETLWFSVVDRGQAPQRRCGQSRIWSPLEWSRSLMWHFPPANSETVSEMGEQFGELFQYYYNIWHSHMLCTVDLQLKKKKRILIYCLRRRLTSADKDDLCHSEKPSLIQKNCGGAGMG